MTKVAQFSLVAILIFISALQAIAQQDCNRHVESQGGFSICIPDGWTGRERENQKYKVLFGEPSDSFTPNINFKEETTAVPLSEYVAAGIKKIIATRKSLAQTALNRWASPISLLTRDCEGFGVFFWFHIKVFGFVQFNTTFM